jgi:hypothetical protein
MCRRDHTSIKDNMLIDPSMQKEIIRRAVDGNFGDNPGQAVQSLGTLKTPDGREVGVHIRHAADAVLLDNFGHVVLVTRKHNPGAGLKALPGGFMDPVQGSGGATVAEGRSAGYILRDLSCRLSANGGATGRSMLTANSAPTGSSRK